MGLLPLVLLALLNFLIYRAVSKVIEHLILKGTVA